MRRAPTLLFAVVCAAASPAVVATAGCHTQAAPVTGQFAVHGMYCESCVEGITGTLELVEGVEWVEVDLKGEVARVRFDPSKVTAAELVARVEKMGYVPGPFEPDTEG